MNTLRPIFIAAALAATAALAEQPAQLLHFQGRLLQGTNPVTGSVGLSLRVYTNATGGQFVYEDSNSVTVSEGLYSAYAGDNTTFGNLRDALAAANGQAWLEVLVDGTPLLPRERVGSAATAIATGPRGISNVESGLFSFVGGGASNRIDGTSYGWIAGGAGNHIEALTDSAAIGGGRSNVIGGLGSYSRIDGGEGNTIGGGTIAAWIGSGLSNSIDTLADYSAIAGGARGRISAPHAWIGGGKQNRVDDSAPYGVLFGGGENLLGGAGSVLGGGELSIIGPDSDYSVLGGGAFHWIDSNGYACVIGGGAFNGIGPSSVGSAIGGGAFNAIYSNAFAVLRGGYASSIQTGSSAAVILGGTNNTVGASASFIAGGSANAVSIFSPYASVSGARNVAGPVSTVQGGVDNSAVLSQEGVVAGGGSNLLASSIDGVILGGRYSTVINASYATVAGGSITNLMNLGSDGAVLVGGSYNIFEQYSAFSTIFGSANTIRGPYNTFLGEAHKPYPSAEVEGATVLGDSSGNVGGFASDHVTAIGAYNFDLGLLSEHGVVIGGDEPAARSNSIAFGCQAGPGSFNWRQDSAGGNAVYFVPKGGVRFSSGAAGADQQVSWVPGDFSWSFTSDRATKENFAAVDGDDVLDRISRLPISTWTYIGYPQRHVGPVAQDFHALFPWSGSDRALNSADLHGLTLAAIQALNRRSATNDARVRDLQGLESAWDELKQRMEVPHE